MLLCIYTAVAKLSYHVITSKYTIASRTKHENGQTQMFSKSTQIRLDLFMSKFLLVLLTLLILSVLLNTATKDHQELGCRQHRSTTNQ